MPSNASCTFSLLTNTDYGDDDVVAALAPVLRREHATSRSQSTENLRKAVKHQVHR